jgi:predicted DNA binding protein
MTIAEVHVSHPDLVLSPTIRASPGSRIEREFQPVPIVDNSAFVLFFAAEGDFSRFEDAIEVDRTVTDPLLVADYGDHRVYRIEITEVATLVTPKLAELGIQLLDVQSDENGWLLRVVLPDRDALATFGDYCTERGIDFHVRTMYRKEEADTRGGYGLTDLQSEALTTALERGYFDDPRRVSLQELAADANVSPTAMGRRIRRATAKLVAGALDNE